VNKKMDYAAVEKAVLADIHDPAKKIKRLEAFMYAVAEAVGCLPSVADPSPDGGNAHIMQKLRDLTIEGGQNDRAS